MHRILATMGERGYIEKQPELEAIVSKCSFKRFTDRTITNKEELIRQVRSVRSKGWSVDDEEHDEGIRCLASPVFDYRGKVIAAVSVSGSNTILSAEDDESNGSIVRETVLNISKRLGYRL